MGYPHPARWDVTRTRPAVRVDVYSAGRLVMAGAPITAGHVNDQRGEGVRRRSLGLTVPASWEPWFKLPRLEVWPHRGFEWSPSNRFLCPMGRFLVDRPTFTAPRGDFTVQGRDYWGRVESNKYLAQVGYRGDATAVAARLIREAGAGTPDPVITATSDANVPAVVWEDARGRHEVIVALMETAGAETFFDREGQPLIVDDNDGSAPLRFDGPGGNITTATNFEDTSAVINRVVVISSHTDGPKFRPVTVAITDRAHPAHPDRLGEVRTFEYASPLLTSTAQAVKAGTSILRRESASAIQWTTSGPPDPAIDSGDAAPIRCRLGSVRGVALDVTTPLDGRDQTITWGAAA